MRNRGRDGAKGFSPPQDGFHRGFRGKRIMGLQVGQALRRRGVVIGRRPHDTADIPDMENYTNIRQGAGYKIHRAKRTTLR